MLQNKITVMDNFFANSALLEYFATKPLSHIRANWELTWNEDTKCYEIEEDSYANDLNILIQEIKDTPTPDSYHANEDQLAEYVKNKLGWPIYKERNRWICDDYRAIIDQGVFSPNGVDNLLQAIAGRVEAARSRGQMHFDDMEQCHRQILGFAMATILYIRS